MSRSKRQKARRAREVARNWTPPRRAQAAFFGTPEWSAPRRCLKCGATENLNLHHRTYVRFGGEELPKDLASLCVPCHTGRDGVHAFHRTLGRNVSLAEATALFLGERLTVSDEQLRRHAADVLLEDFEAFTRAVGSAQ